MKLVTRLLMLSLVVAIVQGCKPVDNEAIDAVKAAITVERDFRWWVTGPLEDGTAVLSDLNSAFWVKDGTVYTVNSMAAVHAKGAPKAPDTIDLDAVLMAVGRKRKE